MPGRARQSNVDRISSNAARAASMWAGSCDAMTDVRSKARPGGTAGGMAQLV
jgi:hypothetical protein